MSSRMKPWEWHVFKMAELTAFAALQMPDAFSATNFLSQLQLLLRLVSVHLPVLTQKVFLLFLTSKSSEAGFVLEAGIIANYLGKFLVETVFTGTILVSKVAPRYNEPRYNEDPVITNNI